MCKDLERKLDIAAPCYMCNETSEYCKDFRSKCFGELCGIVPYTGKYEYERILADSEREEDYL